MISRQFELALNELNTFEEVARAFEAELRPLGYRYFDVGSMNAAFLSTPKEATRFYTCNYYSGDVWRYFPKGWPIGDPITALLFERTTPIDYIAALKTAPSNLMTKAQLNILNLYNVSHAWLFPLNSPSFLQFVTVYMLGGHDDGFIRTRDRVAMMSAQMLNRLITLHVEGAEQTVASGLHSLTEKENECLWLVARGMSNDEIAAELGLSANTVRYHLKKVFKKLGVKTRAAAASVVAAATTQQ